MLRNILLCVLISSPVVASEFHLVSTMPDSDFFTLKNSAKLPPNPHTYDTGLGVTSRCYKGSFFVILSRNAFGEGFELTTTKPPGAKCLNIPTHLTPIQTGTGISLGSMKAETLGQLKAPKVSGAATFLYNRQITYQNKPADQQIWVDVAFDKDSLSQLKVFVSITQ